MRARAIAEKKFLEAILGDKEELKIGQFLLKRVETGGILVLTSELEKAFNETKTFKEFRPKQKKINEELKNWKPEPITKEELEDWIEEPNSTKSE